MKEPIIIVEHGDVEMFSSATSASNYLEAIDVRNNEYSGFDAEGYRLSITADEHDHVLISQASPLQLCPEELEKILREYAIRVGYPRSVVENKGLRGLIPLVSKYAFNR